MGEGRAPRVLLAVTGCIAAYKAVEVMRNLQHAGCEVRVVMSEDATRFVGATTFEALSGHPVLVSLYDYDDGAIGHISLTDWADIVLVCPATANMIAKMRWGLADDAISTAILAAKGDVLVAPAMNVRMWTNPATQENVSVLRQRGVQMVLPVSGLLACGAEGEGKLADVDVISDAALMALGLKPGLLDGVRVVVTAGPTQEAIDPVRYIGNRSSGKMGFEVARALSRLGADVVLVAGPVSIEPPAGVETVNATSASEMYEAATSAFETADAAICAAAVADYTPAHPADHKLKKGVEPLDSIELVETRDILAELSRTKGERTVIGFAAETGDAIAKASEKIKRKGCDMLVANDVSRAESTFGSDTNRVAFVTAEGAEELPLMSKAEVADAIAARLAGLLGRS